jgi:hypothetical protein
MLKQLTRETLGAHADGVADDTAAMLAAPDKVQQTANQGIVLVPSGRYRIRYRITHTIYLCVARGADYRVWADPSGVLAGRQHSGVRQRSCLHVLL